jgi:hypothetical protein
MKYIYTIVSEKPHTELENDLGLVKYLKKINTEGKLARYDNSPEPLDNKGIKKIIKEHIVCTATTDGLDTNKTSDEIAKDISEFYAKYFTNSEVIKVKK